jgi:hypothetical protein
VIVRNYLGWGCHSRASGRAKMSCFVRPINSTAQVPALDVRQVFGGLPTLAVRVGAVLRVSGCRTCFSEENQVQTYMHARIKFHAYGDI